jgi:hypothetical protein
MKAAKLFAASAIACVLAASLAASGETPVLKSQPLKSLSKVDGSPADWPALTVVAPKVSVGVANDDTTLRLMVSTTDTALFDRLRLGGLLIYLDPKNKKAETFAVFVPPLGGRVLPGEKVVPYLTYVEVLGPEKDEVHLIDSPPKFGIQAAAAMHDDAWYIEVALPLRTGEGQPYAIGAAANAKEIGLGLVTPDPPKPAKDPNRGPRGGGFGSWGIGAGSGSYGSMPPPMPGQGQDKKDKDANKPVKLWATIELTRG